MINDLHVRFDNDNKIKYTVDIRLPLPLLDINAYHTYCVTS